MKRGTNEYYRQRLQKKKKTPENLVLVEMKNAML